MTVNEESDLVVEAKNGIRALITLTGRNPDEHSLQDTPKRVVNAFLEMTAGQFENPDDNLEVNFDNESYSGMVVLSGIKFTSICEHHLMPFSGVATVGYIPSRSKVVGLSKLARLVDGYAKRLQIQERLTSQITNALVERLDPFGAACYISASHSCLSCRGAMKPESAMVTSSLYGAFMTDSAARMEFFSLALGK